MASFQVLAYKNASLPFTMINNMASLPILMFCVISTMWRNVTIVQKVGKSGKMTLNWDTVFVMCNLSAVQTSNNF